MKFIVATKPLKDALNLIVVNSNINSFNLRTGIIQLCVEDSKLRMNTESTLIFSEVHLDGEVEGDGDSFCTLDCLMLKNLISTISDIDVTLDFQDNSLDIYTKNSNFSIPKKNDEGIQLDRPEYDVSESDLIGDLEVDAWKFVKKNQAYALCALPTYKVYNFAWVSKKGIITGDPVTGYFTFNDESSIEDSCLMSMDIINLLASFEEGSKLYKTDGGYVVKFDLDSFTLISQFDVYHEEEDGIDSYGEDLVFDMIYDESDVSVDVDLAELLPFIKQTMMISAAVSEEYLKMSYSDGKLSLSTPSTRFVIDDCESEGEFECTFRIHHLSNVLNHMDRELVKFYPIVKEGEVYGLKVEGDHLVALIGGTVDDSGIEDVI